MTDAAEAFHTAQEAALRGSAPLAAALGLSQLRLYSETPANAPLPYLVIGDDQVLGGRDDPEIHSTLHVWTRSDDASKGSERARQAAGIVGQVLDVNLAIEGLDVVSCELVSETYLTAPDGATHGVLIYRYLTVRATV